MESESLSSRGLAAIKQSKKNKQTRFDADAYNTAIHNIKFLIDYFKGSRFDRIPKSFFKQYDPEHIVDFLHYSCRYDMYPMAFVSHFLRGYDDFDIEFSKSDHGHITTNKVKNTIKRNAIIIGCEIICDTINNVTDIVELKELQQMFNCCKCKRCSNGETVENRNDMVERAIALREKNPYMNLPDDMYADPKLYCDTYDFLECIIGQFTWGMHSEDENKKLRILKLEKYNIKGMYKFLKDSSYCVYDWPRTYLIAILSHFLKGNDDYEVVVKCNDEYMNDNGEKVANAMRRDAIMIAHQIIKLVLVDAEHIISKEILPTIFNYCNCDKCRRFRIKN